MRVFKLTTIDGNVVAIVANKIVSVSTRLSEFGEETDCAQIITVDSEVYDVQESYSSIVDELKETQE